MPRKYGCMPTMSLLRFLTIREKVLLPMKLPFSAYLNEDTSIDLDFYRAIGEVEIVVSRDGEVFIPLRKMSRLLC